MSNSNEDKSQDGNCHCLVYNIVIVIISVIAVISFWWLSKMTDVLTRKCSPIEVYCDIVINGEEPSQVRIKRLIDKAEENVREDAALQAYHFAEENLRATLSAWLSIVGFFGVVFGLIAPLSGFLLQRRSLLDERERIEKDIDKKVTELEKVKMALEVAQEEIKQEVADMEKRLMDAETKTRLTNDKLDKLTSSSVSDGRDDVKTGPINEVYASSESKNDSAVTSEKGGMV